MRPTTFVISNIYPVLAGFAGLLLVSSTALSQVKEYSSDNKKTQLIELFSSEGCSSCPPAEAYFRTLRQHPQLWKDFIPVEFHVDYWNYLGWTDPFSLKRSTARQRDYSNYWQSLGLRRSLVYTPAFFKDGREWRPSGGSQRFIREEATGILKARKTSGLEFEITFEKPDSRQALRVYAALLGNGLANDVNRGENAGSRLQHDFVVLHFTNSRMQNKAGIYNSSIRLKKPKKVKPSSYSVAFWVSEEGSPIPLQATGGDL